MSMLQSGLTQKYISLFPGEAAKHIEQMPAEQSLEIIASLSEQEIAALCEHTSLSQSQPWIMHLPADKAVAVLQLMATDMSALLIRRLPKDKKSQVLQQLPEGKRLALSQSLDYPGNTIGAITDPAVLSVLEDMPVKGILDLIRDAQSYEHHAVYVVNWQQVLTGVLSLREFIVAKPEQLAKDVMKKPGLVLSATSTKKALAEVISTANESELPVIDDKRHLLGILRKSTMARLEESSDEISDSPPETLVVSFAELFWQITAMFLPSTVRKNTE